MLRRVVKEGRALPREQFAALRDAMLGSPLVGRSTLAGPFQPSRGFAVTFRGERGRRTVESRFPSISPWFHRVLGAPSIKALRPWWLALQAPARVPNAWYLNVLMVSEGGQVTRHLDTTLREPSGSKTAAPEVVSVLYLSVPSRRGGELELWSGTEEVARVRPRENSAVHFRGDLAHAVRAFEKTPGGVRVSVVIEQYHFEPEALARLPEFQLDSRAGFEAFLKVHEGPGRQFDVD